MERGVFVCLCRGIEGVRREGEKCVYLCGDERGSVGLLERDGNSIHEEIKLYGCIL